MIRLHTPELTQPPALTTLTITDAKQVHHLRRVLRIQPNEQVELFTAGRGWLAEVTRLPAEHIECRIIRTIDQRRESPLHTHIGLCLSRGGRMDYSIQKSVELGVHAITPLTSQRSQPQQAGKRLTHWQAIATSAATQSGRLAVPVIHQPTGIAHWIESLSAEKKLVLHEQADTPLAATPIPTSVALLIGPEGGLTAEEVALATRHAFAPTLFGTRILRCETAAPAVLAVVQHLWGDTGLPR